MTGPAATRLRVHAFLPASRANGPGLRAVLWTQGCSLGCPGCFNPETHPFAGSLLPVDEVFRWITDATGIEGLTVSGGEPLQQWPAVRQLLQMVRAETDLSVVLFSGYSLDEIGRRTCRDVVSYVDVLIAGRYASSAPKAVHLLGDRYTAADMAAVPTAEVVIAANGDVVITGIDPPAR